MEKGAESKKRVLYSPLDWGLGHASRSILYIHRLREEGYEVVVAADGGALALLQGTFPGLVFVRLPFPRIRYSRHLPAAWKIFFSLPVLLRALRREHRQVLALAEDQRFDLIVSDHRYGVWHPQIPSELVIHQLWFRLPRRLRFLEPWLFRLHQKKLSPFSRIIVPDEAGEPNYAGLLSHPPAMPEVLAGKITYAGIFSRFLLPEYCREMPLNRFYEVVVILSGPEPQRSELEKILVRKLRRKEWQVLMVRGLPWKKQGATVGGNIRMVSHLPPDLFYNYLKKARYIIARAGYSTIMDLTALQRRALLIPTPGQTEQEYLAEYLAGTVRFVTLSQKALAKPGREVLEEKLAEVEE